MFNSFWMGGFESACHINESGERLDMIAATQHDRFADSDYQRLLPFGIRTVRDTVRWHLVEPEPGRYDFSSLTAQIEAARRHGVQVIWDLCHYGLPDGLDLFSSAFVDRFARFCEATVAHLQAADPSHRLFTPINEVSFFAWAAGEVGWFFPYAHGRGSEAKRQMIRATIQAIEAIWSVDPTARIATVEPIINVIPPKHRPDLAPGAEAYRRSQFEAWDMLGGLTAPELGGKAKYLDVMGVNFYHDNQWEHPGGVRIHWHILPRDARWRPFHSLVAEVFERYRRRIFVAETSHVGSGRAAWIREMAEEVALALDASVPIEGMCLYPIVDRFEWNNKSHWHNSGLWDYHITDDGLLNRVLNEEYAIALRQAQDRVARARRHFTYDTGNRALLI
jgi:hypothetical protein